MATTTPTTPESDSDKLRRAGTVYVTVMGTDDVFYARVSKSEATKLLRNSDGQLEVIMDKVDGIGINAYIDRRTFAGPPTEIKGSKR